MLGQLRGWEWLILVALLLLLFGAKRLPEAARGLGRSMRIFKAETRGMMGEGETDVEQPLLSVTPAESAVGPVLPTETGDKLKA